MLEICENSECLMFTYASPSVLIAILLSFYYPIGFIDRTDLGLKRIEIDYIQILFLCILLATGGLIALIFAYLFDYLPDGRTNAMIGLLGASFGSLFQIVGSWLIANDIDFWTGIYLLSLSEFLLFASGALCLLKTIICHTFHYEQFKTFAHSVFVTLFLMPLLIYKPVESGTIIRYVMCLPLLFAFHFLLKAPITCIIIILSLPYISNTYVPIGEEMELFSTCIFPFWGLAFFLIDLYVVLTGRRNRNIVLLNKKYRDKKLRYDEHIYQNI